jgi:hypothetical protein
MGRRMPWLPAALAAGAAFLTGCVDRRFIVESAPPGAAVYVNDKRVGEAPIDVAFTYYGTYRFVVIADGYERLTFDETVRTPWWAYFPLDFFSENVWPLTIRDVHVIQKPLEMVRLASPKEILERGEALRARGQTIGEPLAGARQQCAPVGPPVQPTTGYMIPGPVTAEMPGTAGTAAVQPVPIRQ